MKMFYGDSELRPAPQISITQNNIYANDIIIGYNYTITLTGYAISEHIDMENDESLPVGDIAKVLIRIDELENILIKNGSNLIFIDENNGNAEIVKAVGGTLRSLNFEQNPNNWLNYAQYVAEIDFNELILLDDNISCANSYLNSNSIVSQLINVNKYKLKSFSDSWSFDAQDESVNYYLNDSNQGINNSVIKISYKIDATGQTIYNNDQVLPAWVQAKNFVQQRLYDQVTQLDTIFKIHSSTSCGGDSLNNIGNYGAGILQQIKNAYSIFNEQISCTSSESDGTFSLTYDAILKIIDSESFGDSKVLHTVNKVKSSNRTGLVNDITISIEGEITGLCDGGIINSNGNFRLPKTGAFLITNNTANKYDNAYNFLSKIFNDNKDNLNDDYMKFLDITIDELNLTNKICTNNLKPSSFNLTKDYMKGIISYSAEYSSIDLCVSQDGDQISDGNISSITVDINPSKQIISEHIVPGGDYLLQDLGTKTSHQVVVKCNGKIPRRNCVTPNIINTLIKQRPVLPNVQLPITNNSMLIDQKLTNDLLKGTYTLTLTYLCHEGYCV